MHGLTRLQSAWLDISPVQASCRHASIDGRLVLIIEGLCYAMVAVTVGEVEADAVTVCLLVA